MTRISVLIKKTLQSSLTPKKDTAELTYPFHHVTTQQKVSRLQPRRVLTLELNHAGILILTSSRQK